MRNYPVFPDSEGKTVLIAGSGGRSVISAGLDPQPADIPARQIDQADERPAS